MIEENVMEIIQLTDEQYEKLKPLLKI